MGVHMRLAGSIRWILLLLAGGLVSALALAQGAVCEVVALKGEAQSGGKALAVGDKLAVGAEVRTGANGRVRLRFVDGSMLVVSDASQVRIEQFEPASASAGRAAALLLDVGLIGQKVTPSATGSWMVRTPTAVTAVRGTEFIVEVGSDRKTIVNVQSGSVEVEPTLGLRTRTLGPRLRVRLQTSLSGTQCDEQGQCTAANVWSSGRVQQVKDRLAGV